MPASRKKNFNRNEFLSKTWPEALESGEFAQTNFRLKDENGSRDEQDHSPLLDNA